jgi:hypothetical protein
LVPDSRPKPHDRLEVNTVLSYPTTILSMERDVMESQTLTFTLEKETKNTIRYQEETNGKPPAVGTLYIQKWLLGKAAPKTLTVTIAEQDAANG